MIFALCLLFPLACSSLLGDGAQSQYDEAIVITVARRVLWPSTRRTRRELQPRDGFLLVALVWTVLPAFATLPLLFYLPELSFTDAYFEAVSGLTTTGATVLDGLDQLPPSINFWRAFLVWLGGMGVIVLAVAILPLLGVGGSQIYKAETPGPMKDTKLTPRIAETAKGLWLVYFVHHRRLPPLLPARRHELARRDDACVLHHGPGRVLLPRRELRLLELAGDRGRGASFSCCSRASISPRISLPGGAQLRARTRAIRRPGYILLV